jgi:hypothetical protein
MAASQEALDALVNTFMQASMAEATKSSYRCHMRAYLQFCTTFGYISVPASSITICRYIAHLSKSLKYSSIKQYIGIIRLLHSYQGYPNPLAQDVRVNAVLKGVRRLKGDVVCRKLPMTPDILSNVRDTLDMSSSRHCTFWAACLVAFVGMLRKSSLFPPKHAPPLLVGAARVFGWGMSITFRYSKTVQMQQREVSIALPWNTNKLLCPCTALLRAWSTAGASSRLCPLLPVRQSGSIQAMDHGDFSALLAKAMTMLL